MATTTQKARSKCLDLIFKAQTSHIGSVLSAVEMFESVFKRINLDKDKFVLSAGWKACLLYYHLWKKGRITTKELNSYCKEGSKFIGLAEPVTKDIMIAGGSMGLGIAGAVGLALAKKLKNENGAVYCLISDGEMNCGTTWESATLASHYGLYNLVVLVDNNGLQAMGATKDILDMGNVKSKWRSFGWCSTSVDGHSVKEIDWALDHPNHGKPRVIICNTTKGKGVSFMENNNDWHYLHLDEKTYNKAKKCLK